MSMVMRATFSWLTLLGCLTAGAAEGPVYFRGDQGIAADKASYPSSFNKPSALVWKQSLAQGHSSPCVHGAAVYLTTYDGDKKLATVALDRATGRVRWSHTIPNTRVEPFHPTNSPASSTVACDGQRVYAFFGSYGLIAYDLQGQIVWQREFGPFQDEFGSSSSPVLVDGKLLLNEDHDLNSFLLCVDPATGKTLWQTSRDGFTRSYATPVIWNTPHGKQVIVAGALQLASYDLQTGKQIWSLDGFARIVNTTPIIANGLLYVATWSPGGDTTARLSMEPWDVAIKQWDKDKDGKLTRSEVDNKDVLDRFYRIDLNQDKGLDHSEWVKYARVFELARNTVAAIRPGESLSAPPHVVWQYDKGIPYVSSPLVYGDVYYMVKDGGIVTTLDALSGKLLRTARTAGTGGYYASPVAADGKIYMLSERGMLSVIRAGREWELIDQHDFAERSVATPVVADGRVYIRTEAAVYCFAAP